MYNNDNRNKRAPVGKGKPVSEISSNNHGKCAPAKFGEGSSFIGAGGPLDSELRPLGSKSAVPKGSSSVQKPMLEKGSKAPARPSKPTSKKGK